METTTETLYFGKEMCSFTLRQASVHAPNTWSVVPQESWVCEINLGAITRNSAVVVNHLILKVIRRKFLEIHLLVFHLQSEDASFKPCEF